MIPQTGAMGDHRINLMSDPMGRDIRVVITGKRRCRQDHNNQTPRPYFAQEGFHVLAVDGDPHLNLAVPLGVLSD